MRHPEKTGGGFGQELLLPLTSLFLSQGEGFGAQPEASSVHQGEGEHLAQD